MTTITYTDTWDLDTIFPGGSNSPEFQVHLQVTEGKLHQFLANVENWQPPSSAADSEAFNQLIDEFQAVGYKIRQAGAFASCLEAQNMHDKQANKLRGQVTQLSAVFQKALIQLDEKLKNIDDVVWEQLLSTDLLSPLAFALNERRVRASEKRSKEEEAVISSLSVDGYHGWGQFYNTIVKNIKIPFSENGEEKLLSAGQASNKLSSPDRNVRAQVFSKWEETWQDKADYFAATLNHLAGFRLNVYKQRGWEDVLKEPLTINRMTKETLDTMWTVIRDNKQPFVDYLNRKAKLLGLEKLSWFDIGAPLADTETKIPYQEGAEFILEQFGRFGEKLPAFAQMAFENRWIEAEDRDGKRPGGFCTSFPESKQSRIFMTYSGTPSNVSTLAHELGHAFHSYAMLDVHPMNKGYAMNVAETASTFAEMIVADASVKQAKSQEEKIALLEDKIQRSTAFFMNIHARFLFETSFYEERKTSLVSAERLNQLMEAAQKEAYCDALDQYHPMFWASKLHFYITGTPFYNFPYTFGYLFSLGIYARALGEGKGYEEKYIALLKDTASMTVEDLAKKHLNVDLTKRDFWESAVNLCIEDVEEFLELTK
ncbi:M3 family oligoendopeptidase [Caldibacillus lycopersici]|uniref:M3 family oligoendopeptidase n=1 Tax=Perspicuibacillus lycopersici TaxID=1325689 RepID=A0AAE3IV61_9BACI|nr:M3 family oligoendopeptidase [Perspicuibacillus lycopersici]MCU9613956.1 M3 family oligoendopeptidase [Perspicuibacillus lycopersici]